MRWMFFSIIALVPAIALRSEEHTSELQSQPNIACRLLLEKKEEVSQGGFAKDAWAFTVRTQLGWETASWRHLKALVEFEDVRSIAGSHSNFTFNGPTACPA